MLPLVHVLSFYFQFYLIVASIMGQPTPFDIFSYSVADDPFIIDDKIAPNFTTTVPQDYEYDSSTYPSNELDALDEEDLYRNHNTEEVITEYEDKNPSTDIRLEYVDDMAVGENDLGRRSFETYEVPPPYVSDLYPSVHSINQHDLSSVELRNYPDVEDRTFTEDQAYYDSNPYPTVRRFQPDQDVVDEVRGYLSNRDTLNRREFGDDPVEINREAADRGITRGPYQFLVPTSRTVNKIFNYSPIPTQRVGELDPTDKVLTPRQKYIKRIESEIMKTIGDLRSDASIVRNRRLFRRNRLEVGPLTNQRMNVPGEPIENRKLGVRSRMMYPLGHPSLKGPRFRNPLLERNLNVDRRLGTEREVQLDDLRLKGAASTGDRRFIRRNYRGPRNTRGHSPPPEFRYPSSAENIQDIINHMTQEEKSRKNDPNDERREIDYKVGHQNHVLKPEFVPHKPLYSYEDTGVVLTPRATKSPPRRRHKFRNDVKLTRLSPDLGGIDIEDSEEELIFHDDGTISHVSKFPSKEVYEHKPRNTEDSIGSSVYDKKPYYRSESEKKIRPFKLMLDVYPIVKKTKSGKTVVRYESRFRPRNSYAYDDEPSRGENESSDSYFNSDEKYSVSPYDENGRTEDPYEYRNTPRVSSGRDRFYESAYTTKEREATTPLYYPPRSRPAAPEEDYYPRNRPRYPEPEYIPRDYGTRNNYHSDHNEKDTKKQIDVTTSGKSDGNSHTITLHINLYNKKPDYERNTDERR